MERINMKKLIIILGFTLVFSVNANAESMLESGECICANGYQYLESANGTFVLRLEWYEHQGTDWVIARLEENGFYTEWYSQYDSYYDDGYGDHVNQWENVNNAPQSRLDMQGDGNLVLYGENGSGQPVWASGTDGNNGAYLSIQNDGNMVIYDSNDQPIWSIF